MQKALFKEYRDLLREAEHLELLLKSMKRNLEKDKSVIREIILLENKVMLIKRKTLKKALEVTRFIDKCQDSYIRQILILRFINGYSWDKISFRMGGTASGDCIRKTAERYLEKAEKEKRIRERERKFSL